MPKNLAASNVASASTSPFVWNGPVRGGVSIAVLIHLLLVICVPMSMVDPGSPLARRVVDLGRPYVEAFNISHGYAFFAPDPGRWSHLIRYRIEFDDDREAIEGQMPNLDDQWPRLLYHRHFMLTEQLGALGMRVDELNSFDAPEEQRQAAERELRTLTTSYAQHLLQAHEADRVSIDLVRHVVPSEQQVRDGMRLDDEQLFETFPISPLVTVTRDGETATSTATAEEIAAPLVPLEEAP